jgi:protein-disulfide isomerase
MTAIRTPEPRLAVPVGSDDHIMGPDSAGITLVEYGDFECSYCAQAAPVVSELRRLFGDDLRFVFRNMPLTELHAHAERAAEAAEAAALQGRFWEMTTYCSSTASASATRRSFATPHRSERTPAPSPMP